MDQPDLEELRDLLDQKLKGSFGDFRVNVVRCPDLTAHPYSLASQGLCGHPEVIQVGNFEHMHDPHIEILPWHISDLIDNCCEGRASFIIGEGLLRDIFTTKELMMNMTYARKHVLDNNSYGISVNDKRIVSKRLPDSYPAVFDLYGNFLVCGGLQKNVLEVRAKKIDPDVNILQLIRNALCQRYHNSNVGLTGVLLINKGSIEAAVVPPAFMPTSLRRINETEDFSLIKCSIPAPLAVHTTMFNFNEFDPLPDDEMTYVVNKYSNQIIPKDERMGGSYRKDITPHAMEFVGYFNVLNKLHRVHRV